MFFSGFLRCIDTDKTDCCFKTVLNDRDRVAVCNSGAFVLVAGYDNDQKYYDGNNKGRVLEDFSDHQVVFHALLQMIRLMVEGVTPYFLASWS